MHALVNINVGSSLITIGAEGTMACPFDSKNFLYESRISFAVIIFIYDFDDLQFTFFEIWLQSYDFLCKKSCFSE
jgi:hypothetical protein